MANSRIITAIKDRVLPLNWMRVTRGKEFTAYFNMLGRLVTPSAVYQDATDFGDITLIDRSTPVELFISSTDSLDANNIVMVTGLDAAGVLKTRSERMTGSDAQLPKAVGGGATWTKVFRIQSVTSLAFLGDVYCYLSDTVIAGVPQTQAKIQAKARIGFGSSFNGTYTVPTGKRALIFRADGRQSFGGGLSTRIMIRESGGVFKAAVPDDRHLPGYELDFTIPLVMQQGTDIKAQALSPGGTDPISVLVPMIVLNVA